MSAQPAPITDDDAPTDEDGALEAEAGAVARS